MNTVTRSIGVCVLVMSLICAGCGPGIEVGPTETPAATPTPSPTDKPIPTSTTESTSTFTPTATPKSFAIQDADFQDFEEDCKTNVNITSVSGDSFGLTGSPISMINGEWALFCYGAKHTWIGTLTYAGYTFTSDENNPLQFMVTEGQGYIYVKGDGSVTTPEGETIVLGSGSSQEQTSGFQDWRLFLSDNFDSFELEWPTGEDNDSDQLGLYEISGGVYSWTIESLNGYVGNSQIPTLDDFGDFYASVDVEKISGAEDASYGMIFRVDIDWYYYEFLICVDWGEFNINLFQNEEWIVLTDWTESSAINIDGPNQLAVLAEGSQFQFFINGDLVAELENDRIPLGGVGLTGEVYDTGDKVTIHFDNFKVYLP